MEVRANSSPPAWNPRGRTLLALSSPYPFALLALGATLLLLGCGSGSASDPTSSSLVAGGRAAPIPPGQLASAADLARRFAEPYVASIYRQRLPRLPGASTQVLAHLRAVAARIPAKRRTHRPRAGRLSLAFAGPRRLDATIVVLDKRSRPFSIGFTLELRGERWAVVSISPPG